MPTPAPATVAIVNEIADLLSKEGLFYRLSEFEIARINNLISSLDKINKIYAHSYRGAIMSFVGDEQKSLAEHNIAVSMAPTDILVLSNFGGSLMKFRRYAEAQEQLMKAYELQKDDASSLTSLILADYYADDLTSLRKHLADFKRLTGEHHEAEDWLEEDAHDREMLSEYRKESENGPTISLEDIEKELGL